MKWCVLRVLQTLLLWTCYFSDMREPSSYMIIDRLISSLFLIRPNELEFDIVLAVITRNEKKNATTHIHNEISHSGLTLCFQ